MSNSGMPMSHEHHDGGSHDHHGSMPGMQNQKLSKMEQEMSTLMSDPIHHHLAESAGESHTMMQMFFHGGCDEVILFDWWRINTYGGLVASMFACVVLAILYEVLKVYREHVIWRRNRIERKRLQKRYNPSSTSFAGNSSSEGVSATTTTSNGMNDSFEGDTEIDMIEDGGSAVSSTVVSEQARTSTAVGILSWEHILSTSLHLVQISLAYILMLIVMTFNTWLCLAVVLGSTLGYFLVGWKKPAGIDVSDHCH